MIDVANVKWQRGNYMKFFALMKIRVGGANPVDIQEGDEFEYDGSILKYAGAEMPTPQLRGAIKNGWVTTEEDSQDGAPAAVQPSRQVAKAQTVNRDLSKVQRGGREPLESDSLDEETVLKVGDRRPNAAQNPRAQATVLTRDQNRRQASTAGMRVEGSVYESQDAVTIGRVRSPAKIKVDNILDSRSAGIAREIENRGLGKPEFFPDENTVEREGVSIRTNVGRVDRNVQVAQEDDGEVVGQVRHTRQASSDGIEVRDTSNIRGGKASKPVVQKAQSVKIDTKLNPKIRMARRIDPAFPSDWEFTGKLADRLAKVKEHGATPEFLEALYAAEGDQMRKLLEKTYPKQFGG